MENKKILITGATGFTGVHAVQYFKEKGYKVVGTSRKNANDQMLKVDLTRREEVFHIMEFVKPDYVLHLAGQNAVNTSWGDPLATFDVNLLAALHVLEAIRIHQPKAKTVVVGSALEDVLKEDHPASHPYGLSKTFQSWVARKWAELFGLHIVTVKPTNLIGPGFSNGVCALFAEKIANMEKRNQSATVTITNPDIKRDFLDVRDAVKGYDVVLQKGNSGECYEMGTGEFVSIKTIVKHYQEMAYLPFLVNIQHQSAQLTVPALNNEKLFKIGWKPTISLRKSLLDTLNFYRQNS
ncbi:UDP-2-acetamido-2,6-dideoxy-hexulose 4-reductase [Pueribacillus theae]|uniref:UDP-2-acetamido-2,6-dideoxy-hexulose 4-reductase n=1 Tax=Pueribacillus theae TaxID=2171751 RepID=A0A2U1K5C9_9BACI|nr:NAD-dependent epimerase/dehydratase family protein [Pueribacillus theae]PWA12717.1 UDP-2-acetamido-2,6-dideoxy-hexulose 4-reductase [Pueribacillus theae]